MKLWTQDCFNQDIPQELSMAPWCLLLEAYTLSSKLSKLDNLYHRLTHTLSIRFPNMDPAVQPGKSPYNPLTPHLPLIFLPLPYCTKSSWYDCSKSIEMPLSELPWPLASIWGTYHILSHRVKFFFLESSLIKQEKSRIWS